LGSGWRAQAFAGVGLASVGFLALGHAGDSAETLVHALAALGIVFLVVAPAAVARERVTRETWRRIQQRSLALANLAEAVVLTDREGTIVYVNPAFERASGYTAAEALGKTPRILKSDVQDAQVYAALWENLAAGKPWSGRLVNRRRDGRLYEIHQSISAFVDERGRIEGYVAVSRDVTNEAQEQRLRALGELVAEVAHELRSPANALSLSAGMLSEATSDEERRALVAAIAEATARITGFIGDLRAFASPEDARPSAFAPAEAVAAALRLEGPALRHRGIHAEADLGALAGLRVLGYPRRFEQAVLNLLANACEAAPAGRGRIWVVGTRDGGCVELVVEDDGPGVPPEVEARLFEPFVSGRREAGGTGLGLALAARTVRDMKGELRLEAGERGARFRLRLPLASDVD
jgi:two-component system cell cycle sensor histidine kinase/response regulator CckA